MDIELYKSDTLEKATKQQLADLYVALENHKALIDSCEKAFRGEVERRLDDAGKTTLGDYSVTQSATYKKIFNRPVKEMLEDNDRRFVKVKYDVNTATVNEYIKAHRKAPKCIDEQFSHSSLRFTKKKEKVVSTEDNEFNF